jgi:L-seryl-tRNA(Ser) seleniumtransferase
MHALLACAEAETLSAELSRDALRGLARSVLDDLRRDVSAGALHGDREVLEREAAARLVKAAAVLRRPKLRRVINATGVVLHTNLGRSPLSDRVLADVVAACRGYATLEYDLDAGRRGHRDGALTSLLARVTGADDATVVNNCAAAVLLTATALAAGREVIVSRGELVEIGGGFRIPEVIASCGARLVEVGTTNRTRAADYERAITPNTGAILKVHRSNFVVSGFVEEAPVRALVELGRARGVPVLEDLGSGAMVDTTALGCERERTAAEAIADGVDAVMVSGDKLMGGPQAGVIAGRAEVIAKVRRHPLMRALRPGRLVVAALESTLRAYAEGRASRDVAVVAMLATPVEAVEARAKAIAEGVSRGGRGAVVVARTEGRVGGGTLPATTLRSWGVRVRGIDATVLERRLRAHDPPVVARIEDGEVMLDARTLRDDEIGDVTSALVWALSEEAEGPGVVAATTEGAGEDDVE